MTIESWRLDIERTVNGTTAVHTGEIYVPDIGVFVPDTRLQTLTDAWNQAEDLLQAIADAWDELSTLHKHHVRTSAGKLVATIEDAAIEEVRHDIDNT